MRNLIAIVAALVLLATCAFAAIPGADNRKAFTDHDLRAAELAFNKRTLADAYRAAGENMDAKWDNLAFKFLDAMAIRFSNASSQEPDYALPGQKSPEELEKMAGGG